MAVYHCHFFKKINMKKITIVVLVLFINGCVSLSLGENLAKKVSKKRSNESVALDAIMYDSSASTMLAINHILPAKSAKFEMINKNIIFPAIKRNDIDVYNSLKFLAPEAPNQDGNYTFIYIASPYLEDKSYDLLEILVDEYGRLTAEEYFDIWINCFASEQVVMTFR